MIEVPSQITTKQKMKLYSETAMAQSLENNKQQPVKNMTDIVSAMSTDIITDYKTISYNTYCDWKLILEMNDKQGPYFNMLTYEKRTRLLRDISNWEKFNWGR